jgi:hypothetical protein
MYIMGVEESKRPEPLSAVSILTFHDAIEFFLQVVCDTKNLTKRDIGFMRYFELLTKRADLTLIQQGVDRIQQGVENTKLVFQVDFEDLSMSQFVHYEPARNNLEEATRLIE